MSTPYYKPEYFKPYELVPPEIYNDLKDNSFLLLDGRILESLDLIREHFDKAITVNNWWSGGLFKQRGFRTDPVGAKYSQHRYGRAIDFDVNGISAEDVRKEILTSQSKFPYITRMESDTNWVHIDCANGYHNNGIVLFKP